MTIINNIDELPEDKIFIYPNPLNDKSGFKINNPMNEQVQVAIMTQQGYQISTLTSSNTEINVSTSSIPSGAYIVNIFTNAEVYTKKLIVK